MKCIKSRDTGAISRVHDDFAAQCLHDYPGEVFLVPKSEWKAARREVAEAKLRQERETDLAKKKAAVDAREAKKEAKKQKLAKRNKK